MKPSAIAVVLLAAVCPLWGEAVVAPATAPATEPAATTGPAERAAGATTRRGGGGRPAWVRDSAPEAVSKLNGTLLNAFLPVSTPVARSVVSLYAAPRAGAAPAEIVYATVIAPGGLLVTKASELPERAGGVTVKFVGEAGKPTTAPVTLLGVVADDDLALLRIDDPAAAQLPPATLAQGVVVGGIPLVGKWVASVGPTSRPFAVGVVSVGARRLRGGMIGVSLSRGEPVVVGAVAAGSPAERVGIKTGDVITKLGTTATPSYDDLAEIMANLSAGQELVVGVERDGKPLTFSVTLAPKPAANDDGDTPFNPRALLNGALSARRTGFPTVLQHDTVLMPGQMGTPLVDLAGEVVGLNIARAGRVETYALPADRLRELLPGLMAGKFPAIIRAPAATRPAARVTTRPTTRPRRRVAPPAGGGQQTPPPATRPAGEP